MFVLNPNPRFTVPVTVQVPVDGGHEAQTFKCTFQVMGVTDLVGFDFADDADGKNTTGFLKKALVGFDDVEGPNGTQLLFSDASRDALIDLPFTRQPMARAYFAAVSAETLGN